MPDALPDDWTPADHERQYVYHISQGDRGYLVRRGGRDCVRLDRGATTTIRTYRPGDWVPCKDERPFIEMQIAQVALDADCKLCLFLQLHEESRRSWLSMSDAARIDWVKYGPKDDADPKRVELYTTIMNTLRQYTQK